MANFPETKGTLLVKVYLDDFSELSSHSKTSKSQKTLNDGSTFKTQLGENNGEGRIHIKGKLLLLNLKNFSFILLFYFIV